jgi:hypothetical protein
MAIYSSETLVHFQRTTRRYISEYSTLHKQISSEPLSRESRLKQSSDFCFMDLRNRLRETSRL